MVGAGHAGTDGGLHEAGEGRDDDGGGKYAFGVELTVVYLFLGDVAGEVCGKMQHEVSAGTRKETQVTYELGVPQECHHQPHPVTRTMDRMRDFVFRHGWDGELRDRPIPPHHRASTCTDSAPMLE